MTGRPFLFCGFQSVVLAAARASGWPVWFEPVQTSMKISRIYQPRNPLFWIMVALNLLSAGLGWITHTQPLGVVVSLLITFFAVGNACLGAWMAWRLVNS